MQSASRTRQAIPRWSLRAETDATEPGLAGAPPRSATIIPFPSRADRERRVLTYPAAISIPVRIRSDDQVVPPGSPLQPVLALFAPCVIGCLVVILLNLVG